jgi:hypothetical protein
MTRTSPNWWSACASCELSRFARRGRFSVADISAPLVMFDFRQENLLGNLPLWCRSAFVENLSESICSVTDHSGCDLSASVGLEARPYRF